jgi:tetratricopeptide (TPR) repeat protein
MLCSVIKNPVSLWAGKLKFILIIMKILYPLVLSFLLALSNHAETTGLEKVQTGFHRAEQLFEACLFEDAIPLYLEVIREEGLEDETREHIYYQLAQAFFQTNQFDSIVSLLEKRPVSEHSEKCKELFVNQQFILALAYTKLNKNDKAIPLLKEFAKSRPEAHLELGIAYYLSEQIDLAKQTLETLSVNQEKNRLLALSRLYLAKITLLQNNLSDTEKFLTEAYSILSPNDPLQPELAYLKGEYFFRLNEYEKAADHFEKALPKRNQEKLSWTQETLYQLGWSYLKMAEKDSLSLNFKSTYLEKAETAFKRLLEISSDERVYLAIAQYYLIRATLLKEEKSYQEAEKILAVPERFISKEAQTHALLLRAEVAPFYVARDKFYRQLTHDSNIDSSHYSQGWFLRGLNDYREGESLLEEQRLNEAQKHFDKALESFQKSFELLKKEDRTKAGDALKYQVKALQHLNRNDTKRQAIALIQNFFLHHQAIFEAMSDPDELLYLYALISSHLSETEVEFATFSEEILQDTIKRFPRGKFASASLYLLGMLYHRQQHYALAEAHLERVAKDYPNSTFAGDALFWAADAAEKQKLDRKTVQCYLKRVFEQYPESTYAAEAYFNYYTYREYVQGDRVSIKHLQSLTERWTDSPYVLNAYYLMGLDLTRDRKTPEGKWIRKKNLIAAIDSFQEVENAFDRLSKKNQLDPKKMSYYAHLAYRSKLEGALANLRIAHESLGSKREIYLEYAEDVFKQVLDAFKNTQNPLFQHLNDNDPYPQLEEEASFWLAQTYLKAKKEEAANKLLTEMLEKYQSAKITRGYYLSRVWYELGEIDVRNKKFSSALQSFQMAEDAGKGKLLSTDEKLDLWIQQSNCYLALNEYDHAILILSKVVNDDTVSGLRLKAMYLRAEVYEKQGRFELAKKQLESIVKKGGEWGLQSSFKLEKDYGHQ